MGQKIAAAAKPAGKAVHYAAALAGGTRAMGKALFQVAGRVPVFSAVVATGVVAGGIAAFLRAGNEKLTAKQALKDMKRDLGDANHPLITQAEKIEKTSKSRRYLAAGLNTVSEAAYIAPMNGLTGVMLVTGVATQLPQLATAIMPENQVLGAYRTLKQAEKHKQALPPQQRAELISHLVAAVPAVHHQGGLYNRLTQPIAIELASRTMTTQELLQFLASPEKFTALSKEIAAREAQKAEAAKAALKTPTAPAVTAKTDAPALSIAAAKGTSQGKLVEPSRAVGQV
jgi:hypothetical protein